MGSDSDTKRRKLKHKGSSKNVSQMPPALSPEAQQRVNLMASVADCEITISDTVFGGLHKAYLVGTSGVLRGLIEEFKGESRIPLKDDDPHDVALLLSLIYEPAHTSLTEATLDAALRMAAKYDVEHLMKACQTVVCNVELTVENLPRWLLLCAANDLTDAVERCLAFIGADDHFAQIRRVHGDAWMHGLPAALVVQLFVPHVTLLHSTLDGLKTGLDRALEKSATPIVEPRYSFGYGYGINAHEEAPEEFDCDADQQSSTVLHRATVEAVQQLVAFQCSGSLERDAALSARAMQRLLPDGTAKLPLFLPYY